MRNPPPLGYFQIQRTRDTCLLQQVGLGSFLMNRLLDALDQRAVQNCTDPRLRRR